jgi:diguanylate cyclase (GGDEF)-like protein
MVNITKNIFKQALDLSPVPTVIIDFKSETQPVIYVNQAFEALSGYDAGELIGRSWGKLTEAEAGSEESAPMEAKLICHPRLGVSEHLIFDLLPLYDGPGTPRYSMGTERRSSSDELKAGDTERDALLSVLRDARMHLRRLDGRDSVTGVLNQRAFDDLLQRDWIMARREKRSLAAIVFRFDSFEGYSQVYGRHAADACLRKVAHAITGSLRRAGDLTARCADDRFIVMMGHADEQQAADLARQIAARVRGLAIHHPRSEHDRFVTVSCGIAAMQPGSPLSPADLLAAAEASLDAKDPATGSLTA